MRKYCKHPTNGDRVKTMCPETCDVCPGSTNPPVAVTTTQLPTTTQQPTITQASTIAQTTCTDRTPKFCQGAKKMCKAPKYLKTMKYKCGLTCGFCTATDAVVSVTTVAPAALEGN